MNKYIVRYKNAIRKKHVIALAAGAAGLYMAFFLIHMNDFQKDPTKKGSLCNQKMTAAINNAYGTNAGNDIIARSTRGDDKAADVSIWVGEWELVHIEECEKVIKAS